MREIELKILIDERQEHDLRTGAILSDLTEEGPRNQTLVSIYYDTPDSALRGAGIALRLRRKGRRWVQTVKKSVTPISGGLAQPIEDEIPVRGQNFALERIGDDDLREEVIGLVRPGLEPVAETRFKRTVRILRTDNGARVELAVDKGEVFAEGQTAPLSEAELELLEGNPRDLFDIAARILARGPIRYSNLSKSARAHLLSVEGHAVEPLIRRKSAPVALDRRMTAEQAAGLVLRECLDHALANIPVTVLTQDAGGPHQLRVGLRRFRSAISAFRPALGRERLMPLADAARRIAAEAGRLRDLDVLAEDMVRPLAQAHPEDPGFDVLLGAIDRRRARVRSEVCETLSGPEVTRFGFDAAAFLIGRGWLDPSDHDQTPRLAQPVVKLARKQLAKRWKALRAYGDRIDGLTIEDRHEMRKEIKKIRYVGETFGSLFRADGFQAFRTALRKLQDAFGALNDVAMAESYLIAADTPGGDDPLAQRAAGRVLGAAHAEASRLWPQAIIDWQRLAAVDPYWR